MGYYTMPSGNGTWGWCELTTNDPAKAKAFYTKLLGWTTQDMDMGPAGTYTLFHRGGDKMGGMMKADEGMPVAWSTYIQVENLDKTFTQARELGADVIVPPSPIPNVGRFAVIKDPGGAAVGLLQYN